MRFGNRKNRRVSFEQKRPFILMGTGRTWRRSCVLVDVSETGGEAPHRLIARRAPGKRVLYARILDRLSLPTLRARLGGGIKRRRALRQ